MNPSSSKERRMKFSEVVEQASDLLQRKGRISYRALQREFALDDNALEDLKLELIEVEERAVDKDGKMLVWTGDNRLESSVQSLESKQRKGIVTGLTLDPRLRDSRPDAAERRQLTVMFCDLVGSTALSAQLDPEDYHAVVQAYHQTCDAVIQRYDGFVPQHLGDGVLVYFGYPTAHEDEAARAVRTALEIVAGLQSLNARLKPALRAHLLHPIQVRIGIHTGLVVIGEIGSSEKREMLALGETPNLAARLQGLAEPDTVVISAATQHLVPGLFEYQDLGPQELKGLSTPVAVYRIVGESSAQSRFEAAMQKGLTPLVGREHEVGLLQERWTQAKQGAGQVVLLSGEPGIGKSRLVQELKEQLAQEGAIHIEFHCSPYHQNSALYPIIEHLQHLLQFTREDAPAAKLEKLQRTLSQYRFPQADTFPLLAALLSLPHPEGSPPITASPQKQKEKTQAALVAWLVEEAEHRPVYTIWEDLHWADPSTLELLTLFLDQAPTMRSLALLTFRPEFTSPWGARSYLTQLTLNRLGYSQVEAMIAQVAASKPLPPEVVEQIRLKTDGVPLFVEELTKMVVETIGAQPGLSSFQLGVPSTLQDALMARLDRLGSTKEIAQLGATIGREFSYELLHVVSLLDEERLQQELQQLVEAELVYQRGLAPQATYLFKHALIQDTAYQSLLKSRRQQLHQQIAQVLTDRFPETVETRPELLAHHYTEAGLIAQAIPYWQQAGQRASQRGANAEAVSHLTTGLELLQTLPDTPARAQQELNLQLALGALHTATKGFAAPEVEHAYRRARTLCEQIGDRRQVFPALRGLTLYYSMRLEHQTACVLADQMLAIAQEAQDSGLLMEAYHRQGATRLWIGEFLAARAHLEQAIALYDPQRHRDHALRYGADPGVACRLLAHQVLWILGYPDQALRRAQEALELALEFSHVNTLGYGLACLPHVHYVRGEWQAAEARAEACVNFATEAGLPYFVAQMTIFWGAALAKQGHYQEGIAKMRQGLAAQRATGGQGLQQLWLALQVEAYIETGQFEEGWTTLKEALTVRPTYGERYWEADLYRLKGELMLQQENQKSKACPERSRRGKSQKSKIKTELRHLTPNAQVAAEACFQQAIETARELSAKSFELRAATSLARLWQQQGKTAEARQMLADVYNWFTEGFDTKDLQEAKVLLEELSH